MSRIFECKVIESSTKVISADDLVNYCLNNTEDNFRRLAKDLGIDVSKEAHKLKINRFLELVKKYNKENDLYELRKDWYSEKISCLQKSYQDSKTDDIFSFYTVLWNQIFSELGIEGYESYPIMEITIDMAQVMTEIVAFPMKGSNDIISRLRQREFLIRVLAEIDYNYPPESQPIHNWFIENKIDFYESFSYDVLDSIVWGFEKSKPIIIKPTSKHFWKKHENTWWAKEIKENLLDGDEEYPLKVIQYKILLHPNWFQQIENYNIFDSTAYTAY